MCTGINQSWVSHVGNIRYEHATENRDCDTSACVVLLGGPNLLDEEAAVGDLVA